MEDAFGIASAVIPTMIAGAVFLPHHLLPRTARADLLEGAPGTAPVSLPALDEPLEEG